MSEETHLLLCAVDEFNFIHELAPLLELPVDALYSFLAVIVYVCVAIADRRYLYSDKSLRCLQVVHFLVR